MSLMKMIMPPLIGGFIGYGTNYLAVKMLFRPLYPVKIGGFTLPFTPGIIPKGKERLANALGKAVGEKLFTGKDMEGILLSEEIKRGIIDQVILGLEESSLRDVEIGQLGQRYLNQEKYQETKTNIEVFLVDKVVDGILKLDIGALIAEIGGKAIKEKTQGTMFAMFVNDKLIASISEPIGEKVVQYVDGDGREKIGEMIQGELTILEEKKMGQVLDEVLRHKEVISLLIQQVYVDFISTKMGYFVERMNISQVVAEKVMDMDVKEIEELVLSVMKNELGMVVNLGALLGFLIGLLNMFFI